MHTLPLYISQYTRSLSQLMQTLSYTYITYVPPILGRPIASYRILYRVNWYHSIRNVFFVALKYTAFPLTNVEHIAVVYHNNNELKS